MNRYVLALGLTAIALFGLNAWSSYFLDHDAAARDFFASRTFTLALLIGGSFAMFVSAIVVAALLTYPARPSGRTLESEDRT